MEYKYLYTRMEATVCAMHLQMVPLGADRCGHLRRSGPGAGGSQEFISVNQTNGFTADPIPLQSPGSPSPESHYVALQ